MKRVFQKLEQAAKQNDLDRVLKYHKMINAETIIQLVCKERPMKIDRNIMRMIALKTDVVTLVRMMGLSGEGGSIEFAQFLYDEGFWRDKFYQDFSEFGSLKKNDSFRRSSVGGFAWRQVCVYFCYHMRVVLEKGLQRLSTRDCFDVSVKVLDNFKVDAEWVLVGRDYVRGKETISVSSFLEKYATKKTSVRNIVEYSGQQYWCAKLFMGMFYKGSVYNIDLYYDRFLTKLRRSISLNKVL